MTKQELQTLLDTYVAQQAPIVGAATATRDLEEVLDTVKRRHGGGYAEQHWPIRPYLTSRFCPRIP